MTLTFADKHPRTFLVLFFGAILIAEPLVNAGLSRFGL